MTSTTTSKITLAEFLKLPETKPASEYTNGEIVQKPMPKGSHSRLQSKLCTAINDISEEQKIAYAFPELRCSFGDRSIVPDIAVFEWQRIPFTTDGEVPDNFELAPDWVIEILSPNQQPNKVIGNILHCLQHGSRLSWFIDTDDRSVLVFLPNQQPELIEENSHVPVLAEIPLELTAAQVFDWLKMA